MPVIVQLLLPPSTVGAPPLGVVRPGIPTIDGCDVLTRVNAFVIDQGTQPTLEYTFRDRTTGTPIDLSAVFGSGGDSVSSSEWSGRIRLRIKEIIAAGPAASLSPIWELNVAPTSPSQGIVQAFFDDARITTASGIFALSWAVENGAGQVVLVNNGLMSIERSLYGTDVGQSSYQRGPMTLGEVRRAIRDNFATENLRLDDVEFSDDEIIDAIIRPICYFNEIPPPLTPLTTSTFPWREHWRQGTIAKLCETAAYWYRRNFQKLQAGGVSDDDLDRHQIYETKAQQLWKEYTDWVLLKKVELNARAFSGAIGSPFGAEFGYF